MKLSRVLCVACAVLALAATSRGMGNRAALGNGKLDIGGLQNLIAQVLSGNPNDLCEKAKWLSAMAAGLPSADPRVAEARALIASLCPDAGGAPRELRLPIEAENVLTVEPVTGEVLNENQIGAVYVRENQFVTVGTNRVLYKSTPRAFSASEFKSLLLGAAPAAATNAPATTPTSPDPTAEAISILNSLTNAVPR